MKMEPAFNSRRIAVNGVTLNVIVEGKGPDVLLVHGFPDCHDVWRHQIPALVEAGYRVIAPDMRGCGLSDAPAATEGLQDVASGLRPCRPARRTADQESAPGRARPWRAHRLPVLHGASRPRRSLRRHVERPPCGLCARADRAEAQGLVRAVLPDPRAIGLGPACRRLVVLANALRLSGRNAELDSAAASGPAAWPRG